MSGFSPDFGPWLAAAAPTVTALTGSITSYTATCNYKQIGKTIVARFLITITNAGTAAGGNDVTLPVTAKVARGAGCGTEVGASGKSLAVQLVTTTTARIRFYDATFAGATNNQFDITITYEAA